MQTKIKKDKHYWEQIANKYRDHNWRMLIGGELTYAQKGETYEIINPANGHYIARAPLANKEDVDQAVEAAARAQKEWAKVPPLKRAEIVRNIARVLRERGDEFAALDAIDSGNPVLAMLADVERAAESLEYAAGLATEIKGETIPSSGVHWHLTRREPYGVVARINPYNHPIGFTAQKIGMPLIAGNTLVVKAPEQPPLSSLLFGEVIKDLLPPGVVNIISGEGKVAGDALVRHHKVRRIALVGSVNTGKAILKSAAETGVKNITLELGGKNGMIVFPDADLEVAVEAAFNGMNFLKSQGQSCGSMSRLFLHESLHDEFLKRLVEKAREKTKIGNPLDPEKNMGCLISKDHFERVMGYIRSALKEGANLMIGGGKPSDPSLDQGLYIEPTIFSGVTPNMRIFSEEIFGPVQSVIKWSNYDDMISMVNIVPYGLTASIWSNDFQQILRTSEDLDVGYIWVNGTSAHYVGTPFSGHKDSGLGSEEGIEELISYTQQKAIHFIRT
ncbi:aldehyde dehydrogenase family protein [Bacillus sp. Marseille-P3661]|uniref:aldehyde dehydrogenase family protein n=1 Tax=Bacillus sp. Marseille-P3661 TaxID=1936234 RepID=UPI001CA4DD13|nr:aldehyde dehydrogenase family protein [Bacillus sp. Marseille-P3661]